MSKVTLSQILTGYRSTQQTNADFVSISTAFDNTLSRDGSTPNQMEAVLDLNAHQIINLPAGTGAGNAVEYEQWFNDRAGGTVLAAYVPYNDDTTPPIGAVFVQGAIENTWDGLQAEIVAREAAVLDPATPGTIDNVKLGSLTPGPVTTTYLTIENTTLQPASAGQLVFAASSTSSALNTGSATALPANVSGYLNFYLGTKNYAIPFYDQVPYPAAKYSPTVRNPGLLSFQNSNIPNMPAIVNPTIFRGALVDTANPSAYDHTSDMLRVDSATTNWVFHGASITQGYGARNYGYAIQFIQRLLKIKGLSANYLIRGLSGYGQNYVPPGQEQTVNTLNAEAASVIDPLKTYNSINSFLHIFDGAANDLGTGAGNESAATAWSNMSSYISARITAGWSPAKICIGTVTNRADSFAPTQAVLDTYNGLVRSNAPGLGIHVIDYQAIPQLVNPLNTTYFADALHPTPAGAALMAALLQTTMVP